MTENKVIEELRAIIEAAPKIQVLSGGKVLDMSSPDLKERQLQDVARVVVARVRHAAGIG